MPKKPFAPVNPALQFITMPQETPDPAPEVKPSAPISKHEIPAGFKRNPEFIEKRDRRIMVLMQPSLYDRIKHAAQAEGVSTNDWIHRALEKAAEE